MTTTRTAAPTVPESEVQPLHHALLLSGWTCADGLGWIPPGVQLSKPLDFAAAVACLRADAARPPRPRTATPLVA